MTAGFYDGADGRLRFRAPAGGGGSVFDGVATEADIAANAEAYQRYLADKHAPPAPLPAPPAVDHSAAIKAAEEALKAMEAENAALVARVSELETLLANSTATN